MTQDSTQAEQTQSPDPAAPADAPVVATDGPDVFCPHCEYNLRGVPVDRCPECGKEFDPATLLVSRVPWTQRRERGRIIAFFATVAMVTFRPGKFAREIARPADYKDARSFRWVLVVFLFIWLVMMAVAEILGSGIATKVDQPDWLVWQFGIWVFACVAALTVFTGVPSWFAAPKRLPVERQNRAIALSYYATAPLACLALPMLLLAYLLGAMDRSRSSGPFETSILVNLLLMLAIFIYAWVVAARSVCRFSLRKEGASAWVYLALLVLWVVLPIMVVVVPILAGGSWLLMYYSLTI